MKRLPRKATGTREFSHRKDDWLSLQQTSSLCFSAHMKRSSPLAPLHQSSWGLVTATPTWNRATKRQAFVPVDCGITQSPLHIVAHKVRCGKCCILLKHMLSSQAVLDGRGCGDLRSPPLPLVVVTDWCSHLERLGWARIPRVKCRSMRVKTVSHKTLFNYTFTGGTGHSYNKTLHL